MSLNVSAVANGYLVEPYNHEFIKHIHVFTNFNTLTEFLQNNL